MQKQKSMGGPQGVQEKLERDLLQPQGQAEFQNVYVITGHRCKETSRRSAERAFDLT